MQIASVLAIITVMMKHNHTGQAGDNKTAFGFNQVAHGEKQGLVNDVFSKVAANYDKMNDLMSGGLHRLWKDDLVTRLNPPKGGRAFDVLDVAGGTGDVAFRIARAGGNGTSVTVADISADMILEGRKRAVFEGLTHKCRFAVANAEALSFDSGRFDAYTIAFGIRNVPDIDQALKEAYRVLKPGGRFLCLEFSQVAVPGLEQVYDTYSMTAVPALGKVVTGDGQPYRYLVESIRTFPNQAQFAGMIEQAGFSRVNHRNLSGGIVAMHSGWRI